MQFYIPKEIKKEIRITDQYSWQDLVVAIFFAGALFLLSFAVHEYLKMPYYIFSVVTALFLVLKSKENPGKHRFRSIIFAFLRSRGTYYSI